MSEEDNQTTRSLSAKELLVWGDLESKRRRQARGLGGLLSWPPITVSILSALLALEIVRRIRTPDINIGPLGFALVAIAFAQILTVFTTPYRMYWRSDSSLLARLSIGGDALFNVACRRSWRTAVVAALPALAAVAVIAPESIEVATRLAILGLACAALGGLMAPAACLLGGAIVASDKAQSVIDSFGGEVKPPGVAWLGALPGLVAMLIALLAIDARAWVSTAEPLVSRSLFLCAAAVVASAAALAWAFAAAPRILIEAQREVAALDQERLAHIDRSLASPLERLWRQLFVRSELGRLVFGKDAALIRRRYPAPAFVAFLGVGLVWILAASSQASSALVVLGSLAAYSIVMARRHVNRPVERARLLRTLPIDAKAALAAKRWAVVLRAIVWVAVPGAAMIVFADDKLLALVIPSAALLFALVASVVSVTSPSSVEGG